MNLKAAERAHIKISGRLLTVTELILNDDDPVADKMNGLRRYNERSLTII